MAAVLAYGEGALLSHAAAAVLWGLRPPPVRELHVTVAGRDVRSRDGIRAHSVGYLHPADTSRHHGIPVTSLARTLLDLAATAHRRELDRATNEARVLHHLTDHSLNEQFGRYPAHRGTRALRQAIHDRAEAHPLGGGAAPARADPSRATARARNQRADRRVRSRLPLARPQSGRRGRRLHVPLLAQFVRARPAPGCRARGDRLRVGARDVRRIADEREAVVAMLARALYARPSDFARSSTVSA